MTVSNPVLFLASDRSLAEEAWAGDIIGIPNHGQLRIGDTLTEGELLRQKEYLLSPLSCYRIVYP